MWSSQEGYLDVVRALLQHGGNVNAANNKVGEREIERKREREKEVDSEGARSRARERERGRL
jgi:hypothetical protein